MRIDRATIEATAARLQRRAQTLTARCVEGESAAEFHVPGSLGELLAGSGYRARLVVERDDRAPLASHDVESLPLMLATWSEAEGAKGR